MSIFATEGRETSFHLGSVPKGAIQIIEHVLARAAFEIGHPTGPNNEI